MNDDKVVIVSAKRTPIGSFQGNFESLKATELGSRVIEKNINDISINPKEIDETIMGCVLPAGLGQAPARQAAMGAGIPSESGATTINKMCGSGMKSIMFGAQSIMLGHQDIVVAGGMENMSNVPYYVPKARWGSKYGDTKLIDGLAKDGLTDAYQHTAMGISADNTATKYEISREEQDRYTVRSYELAAATTQSGKFQGEIVPVTVPQRKGDPLEILEDEEYKRVKFEKIPSLRPAFTKDGTVTAANASTINDGAAALVLASKEKVEELGLKPVAKILSFADAAHEPEWFTTAPAKALPKALAKAGVDQNDVDYFEFNEAFSVVGLANMKILGLDATKVNVNGGAVSLGHPLGASGARIVNTLLSVLEQNNGKIGAAAICNGGGGASAIVIERL